MKKKIISFIFLILLSGCGINSISNNNIDQNVINKSIEGITQLSNYQTGNICIEITINNIHNNKNTLNITGEFENRDSFLIKTFLEINQEIEIGEVYIKDNWLYLNLGNQKVKYPININSQLLKLIPIILLSDRMILATDSLLQENKLIQTISLNDEKIKSSILTLFNFDLFSVLPNDIIIDIIFEDNQCIGIGLKFKIDYQGIEYDIDSIIEINNINQTKSIILPNLNDYEIIDLFSQKNKLS
jgi:hypothetical protein